jgi:multidrug efflux pump subunit AcrA (membrane-fusion protein)
MSSIPHRGWIPDSEEALEAGPAPSGPRLAVLLVGGGEIEAPLRSLARGEYEIVTVPDATAALRILASWRVTVLCIGPGLQGAAARDLVAAVEGGPEAPPVRLVLAGGADLSIFQALIDDSRLYYLSQAPPAPRELDALLRTAVRRGGEVEEKVAEEGRPGISGSLLVELLRRLALLEDPEEIAEMVAGVARDLVGADRAYLLLFDGEKEELWAREAQKGSRRYESAAVGLVSFVLRTGMAVRVPRVGADPRYDRSADDPLGRGDERFLAVPVTAAGHELGVLVAVRDGGRPELGEREEEELAQIAAQVAPSLAAQVLADRSGVAEVAGGPDASLFRREVIEQTLRPKVQADPLRMSPAWARWSYWVLVATLAATLVYAWVGTIDEYATGVAVVETGGRADLTTRNPGTVVGIDVSPGQQVAAGQVLVRFDDARERADFERTEREFTLQLINRLRDPTSSAAEQALISLRPERELARAHLEERSLRSPAAGVVNDVLVRPGQYMQPGQTVLSLAAGATEPSLTVVLPGQYRPQLRAGQPMRFEIGGYRYAYQRLVVASVGDEVIGPAEAQRTLGPAIAETVQVTGPVVLVKARLPSPTFEAEKKTYRYHNGMQGTAEIRVRSERLLWVLVPSLKAIFEEEHG